MSKDKDEFSCETIKSVTKVMAMEQERPAVTTVEGDLLVGLTARDIIRAFYKERRLLRAMDIGKGNLVIANQTFMMRKMLEALGYDSTSIRKAVLGFHSEDVQKLD